MSRCTYVTILKLLRDIVLDLLCSQDFLLNLASDLEVEVTQIEARPNFLLDARYEFQNPMLPRSQVVTFTNLAVHAEDYNL